MMDSVRQCLEDSGLEVSGDAKKAADIAADCALEYVYRYTQDLSEQLILSGLHSQAMVAGTVGKKVKRLLSSGENCGKTD